LWSVTVVRTEIFAGMLTREEKRTRAFLAEIGWIDVDQTLADLAGELARRYVKSHPSVDTVDYIVAASVEALEVELATTNLKHIPMFTGLKKPY
jgi:predicted nucleic acid-binding protein